MTDWGTGALDLDAYLDRVGYRGPREPTEATLRALHRAHVAAVPFENLDVMLGRGVRVDLDAVQDKLVRRRRGGYCYEHGVLFAAVLERLGYRVRRVLARTGDPAEHPRPRSHLVNRVWTADDRPWLADVGFGSGLLEPVPLPSGTPQRQGGWTYEATRDDDGYWRLRERQGSEWVVLMSFAEEDTFPVDVDNANHVTSTHPGSPFTQRTILVRKDDHSVRSLIGRQYSVRRPDGTVEERQLTDDEFAGVLQAEYGAALSDDEVAELTALREHLVRLCQTMSVSGGRSSRQDGVDSPVNRRDMLSIIAQ